MPKRTLIIGVGGSGKASLTILKERLEETYGVVPPEVVLLSIDTDSMRDIDQFAGTQLNSKVTGQRNPEFLHIVSPGGMTMDTVFADIRSGKTAAYMRWLEDEKLDKILAPSERDIRGGAQQRRPIGRTALILRYQGIYQAIRDGLAAMYGEAAPGEQELTDAVAIERGKRLIFIVTSVAGGTGSGMFIDVCNLVREAVASSQTYQSVDVAAVIVLPDAFSGFVRLMEDPTNLRPNSCAALRELDRFMRTHSFALPYMIRYAESEAAITWSTNQPIDHCYLVDTASRSGAQDFQLGNEPMKGVFPAIADFIMSHIDSSLGDAIATLRSNAGMQYAKSEGRQHSSFNIFTYIFPVEDIIESFAYRLLGEVFGREFLPPRDDKQAALIKQAAEDEADAKFSANLVEGEVNTNLMQKAIASTRRLDPETPGIDWESLLSVISLSEVTFERDIEDIRASLKDLDDGLVNTPNSKRKEDFGEGYTRLLDFIAEYEDRNLGPLADPENEESRTNGLWDRILGRYVEAHRERFARAVDAALLAACNARGEDDLLLPYRLTHTIAMLDQLRFRILRFRELMATLYEQEQIDARRRQAGEDTRHNLIWMGDARTARYFPPIWTEPLRAQRAYIRSKKEKLRYDLHVRLYRVALAICDTMASKDPNSVISLATAELQNWQQTMEDANQLLEERLRGHERGRIEKRQVRVRRYLTDPHYENELYTRPENQPRVLQTVLGRPEQAPGLEFSRRRENVVLRYRIVARWAKEAEGAAAIAAEFFEGAKRLFASLRERVSIADRLAASFPNPLVFVNHSLTITEPFLRYNPSINAFNPLSERYMSANVQTAGNEQVRRFFEAAIASLSAQSLTVDGRSESRVACTVLEIARGVKLDAVDQFTGCAGDYRSKLSRGNESIHVFREEQRATDYERLIDSLGEAGHSLHALAPEVIVAMGDDAKLRAFTQACAFGLIAPAEAYDDEHNATTELFLNYKSTTGNELRTQLTQSASIRRQEQAFSQLPVNQQHARLRLDALQTFSLKATTLTGISSNMVPNIVNQLGARGVRLVGLDKAYFVELRDVNASLQAKWNELAGQTNPMTDADKARLRRQKLEAFLNGDVKIMKSMADPRVRDLGLVMQLIIRDLISQLSGLGG